jgi:DNA-binding PucR family transcriptional regulator
MCRDLSGRKTLIAYADANLNAKVASQRLYIHVNTAHNRLARIEEKTGCDLRDLADVQELLIAIRLAAGRSRAARILNPGLAT